MSRPPARRAAEAVGEVLLARVRRTAMVVAAVAAALVCLIGAGIAALLDHGPSGGTLALLVIVAAAVGALLARALVSRPALTALAAVVGRRLRARRRD